MKEEDEQREVAGREWYKNRNHLQLESDPS